MCSFTVVLRRIVPSHGCFVVLARRWLRWAFGRSVKHVGGVVGVSVKYVVLIHRKPMWLNTGVVGLATRAGFASNVTRLLQKPKLLSALLAKELSQHGVLLVAASKPSAVVCASSVLGNKYPVNIASNLVKDAMYSGFLARWRCAGD